MLTVEALRNLSVQKANTSREIKDILINIDEDIKKAYNEGKTSTIVTIPVMFSIPFMSNRDAQRIIYVSVLKDLKNRGFQVEIETTNTKAFIEISWVSHQELDEIKMQIDFLAKHSKAKN